MKIIIPVSSFLLALTAFYLKGVEFGMQVPLAKLYAMDTVDRQLRLDILGVSHDIFFVVTVIALIATALAVVSIYNKLCHKIIGIILLLFSVMSVLCSLIRG